MTEGWPGGREKCELWKSEGDGGRAWYPVLRDLGRHRAGRGGGRGGTAGPGDGQDREEPGGGEKEGAQSGESSHQETIYEVRQGSIQQNTFSVAWPWIMEIMKVIMKLSLKRK